LKQEQLDVREIDHVDIAFDTFSNGDCPKELVSDDGTVGVLHCNAVIASGGRYLSKGIPF